MVDTNISNAVMVAAKRGHSLDWNKPWKVEDINFITSLGQSGGTATPTSDKTAAMDRRTLGE
jgi:hypothetical protein